MDECVYGPPHEYFSHSMCVEVRGQLAIVGSSFLSDRSWDGAQVYPLSNLTDHMWFGQQFSKLWLVIGWPSFLHSQGSAQKVCLCSHADVHSNPIH